MPALVKAVGAVVEKVLVGSGECAVRVWGDGAVASASSASSLADDDADADAEGEPDGGRRQQQESLERVSTHGAGRGNGSGSGTSTGNGNGNGVRSSQHSPFGAYPRYDHGVACQVGRHRQARHHGPGRRRVPAHAEQGDAGGPHHGRV